MFLPSSTATQDMLVVLICVLWRSRTSCSRAYVAVPQGELELLLYFMAEIAEVGCLIPDEQDGVIGLYDRATGLPMQIAAGRAHPLSASPFGRSVHSRAGRLHSRANATTELWAVNRLRKSFRYTSLVEVINMQSK